MKRWLVAILILLAPLSAAAEPRSLDKISTPAIEARLKALGQELRCLVCQNETLADSHAGLAVDLRNEIRGLMQRGMTDEQVVEYLVARYGDFVRFRPALNSNTVLLWFGPLILIVLGSLLLVYYLIRRRAQITPLSQAEHQRLRELLNKVEGDTKV